MEKVPDTSYNRMRSKIVGARKIQQLSQGFKIWAEGRTQEIKITSIGTGIVTSISP